MSELPEPTSEQCSNHSRIEHDGLVYFACWYPQMGGYVGKCLVRGGGPDSCFDCYVWHDGEFPFGEGSYSGRTNPIVVHHCLADQFINFGQWVKSLPDEDEAYGSSDEPAYPATLEERLARVRR